MEMPAGLMRFCCHAFSGGGGPRSWAVTVPFELTDPVQSRSTSKLPDQPDGLSVLEYNFENVFGREDFLIVSVLSVPREKERRSCLITGQKWSQLYLSCS